ncbi:MAG: extracellular solute-binding protein [Lachnospiraceae bacterium]|nr:extracellular solute-binding protein [Lachnospiraceae bacterium]
MEIKTRAKRCLTLLLAMAFMGMMLAGCGSQGAGKESSGGEAAAGASTSQAQAQEKRTDYSGVKIEMLNTKAEIEEQLEAAAKEWGALTGATLNVYTIGSGAPSTEISARYAAGNAPALIMGDIQDIVTCVKSGYARDLKDQS